MILWLMINITFSMILCALHIYHITYPFPAAQIRFLAETDLCYLNKISGKKYVIVYDVSYLTEEGQWLRDH